VEVAFVCALFFYAVTAYEAGSRRPVTGLVFAGLSTLVSVVVLVGFHGPTLWLLLSQFALFVGICVVRLVLGAIRSRSLPLHQSPSISSEGGESAAASFLRSFIATGVFFGVIAFTLWILRVASGTRATNSHGPHATVGVLILIVALLPILLDLVPLAYSIAREAWLRLAKK
jgi:hypothetical protein